ncbi:MAG: PAS domain-containing sensor histidine kinase [Ignavibacteriales bacterium]|nr:MAG: PAS domain-containing sensor histidine kinase [Ignavibacteriales bacterium]
MKENSGKINSNPASFFTDISEEIRSLIELSEDIIFQLDLSWKIININKTGALLLDYQQDELAGKYFPDLFKSPTRSLILKALQETLSDNKIKSFETGISGKYNAEIFFKFRLKAINTSGDVKIIGIGRNLASIKKLEEKVSQLSEKLKETKRLINIEKSRGQQKISFLEELNRMKADFISNISHEFRTPLASIIGFSESVLTDPSMTPEHQKEFIQIILTEGKRLALLINEVLDMTRLEAGGVELNKNRFNFITLLEKAIEEFNDQVKMKKLILSIELPEDEIYTYGDKEKLGQATYGILENAIKFTGRGGRISIFVHALYKEFEVIITDTGIGISKKDLPNIFQKYYNDNESDDGDSKRGLGLVFVKHIVDLHNGSISIQSEINEGTTVIVKLLTVE